MRYNGDGFLFLAEHHSLEDISEKQAEISTWTSMDSYKGESR